MQMQSKSYLDLNGDATIILDCETIDLAQSILNQNPSDFHVRKVSISLVLFSLKFLNRMAA